ncbi:hypothetical protein O4106_23450, partial [Rhodococcus pyridinivorans]
RNYVTGRPLNLGNYMTADNLPDRPGRRTSPGRQREGVDRYCHAARDLGLDRGRDHPILISALMLAVVIIAIKVHAATPHRFLRDILKGNMPLAPEVSAGDSPPPSSVRSVVLAAPVGPFSRPDAPVQSASRARHVSDAAHDLTDAPAADGLRRHRPCRLLRTELARIRDSDPAPSGHR